MRSPNLTSNSSNSSSLEVSCSRQFLDWLQVEQISIAFTTYQTSRLCLVGTNSNGQFSGFERLFDRAMGLYATSDRLYLSTKYQLWQFDNILNKGQLYNGYDKLYIPRIGYTTGDLDIHDVAVAIPSQKGGFEGLVFISTLLNCLATVSQRHSCTPLWKPKFISKLINEDRCHLNGLAMVEGQPGFVTACSRSDVIDGWREKRRDGGVVIDVSSNEIILSGLSMPHSPRFHGGKLWLHNSGTGEFGYVDLQSEKFEAVTFCPGYLRGLTFWKNFAIVGLSKARDKTFSGLILDDRLAAKDVEARCGLMVVDLNSGSIIHWLRLEGIISELYDVQVLPGVKRPMALGFQTDEISQLLTYDSAATPVSLKKEERGEGLGERQSIERSDNYQAWHKLGVALQNQGKIEEAIAHFWQAIQLKPDYVEAYINLALALASQERFQEAIAHAKTAIKLQPESAETLAVLFREPEAIAIKDST